MGETTRGRNDSGRKGKWAKRLGGERESGRNDPDSIKLTVTDFQHFVTANERIFYLIGKIFKVDYVSVFIQQPINSQYYMLISSNPMISVLYDVMWSIGKI